MGGRWGRRGLEVSGHALRVQFDALVVNKGRPERAEHHQLHEGKQSQMAEQGVQDGSHTHMGIKNQARLPAD